MYLGFIQIIGLGELNVFYAEVLGKVNRLQQLYFAVCLIIGFIHVVSAEIIVHADCPVFAQVLDGGP